jgi:hypothetical protein
MEMTFDFYGARIYDLWGKTGKAKRECEGEIM